MKRINYTLPGCSPYSHVKPMQATKIKFVCLFVCLFVCFTNMQKKNNVPVTIPKAVTHTMEYKVQYFTVRCD